MIFLILRTVILQFEQAIGNQLKTVIFLKKTVDERHVG
jgi:hypothetical protein